MTEIGLPYWSAGLLATSPGTGVESDLMGPAGLRVAVIALPGGGFRLWGGVSEIILRSVGAACVCRWLVRVWRRGCLRMSGGTIKVTPEQLAAISGQLNGGASSIEGTLQQLASQVAPLGSDWAGVAQQRFIALWEQWQRSSQQLNQALTEMAQLMQQASAAYDSNEQQVAGFFGGR